MKLDATCYLERSKVREILIGHNAATQAVLPKIDALPIFTAADIGVAQTMPSAKAYEAARDNLREAWAAFAMIRETVETLAPSGSVKAAEHLDGPTFMHEADALVAGIRAMTSVSSTHQLPGAALAEPTTCEAEISSQPERPNRELDSPDRGHTLVSLHQRGEND